MRVKTLTIKNVRNLENVTLSPGPGLNILFGDNGAGKTSVIESLLILAKGRSFRSPSISAVIGKGHAELLVVADIETNEGKSHRVGIQRSSAAWNARLDGQDLKQLSDTATILPVVLMEPNSHLLVSGGPDVRRRYMDWGVFHVEHSFLDAWRRYNRAIKQRNAALRHQQLDMVRSLDPQTVELGHLVDGARGRVCKLLFPMVKDILTTLSPNLGHLALRYQPGWTGESFAEALELSLARDMERGLTSTGPHRADIQIKVNQLSARERLSRGEQKIVSAALILAQAQLMGSGGNTPVLLMDDLMSEFDTQHLQQVMAVGLKAKAQVFVTGTDVNHYLKAVTEDATMFHVKHGEVTPCSKEDAATAAGSETP